MNPSGSADAKNVLRSTFDGVTGVGEPLNRFSERGRLKPCAASARRASLARDERREILVAHRDALMEGAVERRAPG